MSEIENKFIKLIENHTEFWIDEDGKVNDFELILTGRYTQSMRYIIWFPSKLGYDSLGKTDTLGKPYVDFGTFHSDDEPESFIIENEERRWHPVMAFFEVQKELACLIRDLTDLRNNLINFYW